MWNRRIYRISSGSTDFAGRSFKLEYRGYDSAGIAVRNGDGATEVIKAKGRLKILAEKTNNGESVAGTCGIGHTRMGHSWRAI